MRSAPTVRRWVVVVALVVAAQLGSVALAPHLRLGVVGGFVFAFACVAVCMLATAASTPAHAPRALRWLLLPALGLTLSAWLSRDGGVATIALVTASLLVGGSLVGAVVGARIERPSHLWIVALVASAADAWSVLSTAGPSAAAAQSERALALAALSWPLPPDPLPAPILGVGDVVITALFVVAARKHALPLRRSLVALLVGYGAIAIGLLAFERPLPALPVLSVAFVAVHPAVWRLERQDRRPLLVGSLVVVALLIAVWLVLRALSP